MHILENEKNLNFNNYKNNKSDNQVFNSNLNNTRNTNEIYLKSEDDSKILKEFNEKRIYNRPNSGDLYQNRQNLNNYNNNFYDYKNFHKKNLNQSNPLLTSNIYERDYNYSEKFKNENNQQNFNKNPPISVNSINNYNNIKFQENNFVEPLDIENYSPLKIRNLNNPNLNFENDINISYENQEKDFNNQKNLFDKPSQINKESNCYEYKNENISLNNNFSNIINSSEINKFNPYRNINKEKNCIGNNESYRKKY